jgi:hypothetical protein
MPKGADPAGSGVGDDDNSLRSPPCTAKALTARPPVSTTQSVSPAGSRRASWGASATGLALNGVLPSKVREPSAAIEYREMLGTAVFTAKRNRPSWLISIQHGAVWLSGNGDDPMDVNPPSAATVNADTVPELGAGLCALETKS